MYIFGFGSVSLISWIPFLYFSILLKVAQWPTYIWFFSSIIVDRSNHQSLSYYLMWYLVGLSVIVYIGSTISFKVGFYGFAFVGLAVAYVAGILCYYRNITRDMHRNINLSLSLFSCGWKCISLFCFNHIYFLCLVDQNQADNGMSIWDDSSFVLLPLQNLQR